MRNKYEKIGLNYDLITEKYPNIGEYEQIVKFFLDDENFELLGEYLDDEDYNMAKDAAKGLYVLAGELRLYPIYERVLEIYEDLEVEIYDEVMTRYNELMNVYKRIRSIFYDA